MQYAWSLRVVCDCMSTLPQCVGHYCTAITKSMGYVVARQPTGHGTAFVEPSALTTAWKLRLGPTLLTPQTAFKGCGGSILTAVLKRTVHSGHDHGFLKHFLRQHGCGGTTVWGSA